jgi:hypothetical protein
MENNRSERLKKLISRKVGLAADHPLVTRFVTVAEHGNSIRSSEYHITNACNIRCDGCWFFEHGFDAATKEEKDITRWREFVQAQAAAGINAPLLIGGEPTLYLDRVALFAEHMPYVCISSNGLKRFPREGFERVNVALSLFGGGKLDDQLRAIKPNGKRFDGLFSTALRNYQADPRAIFIYALSVDGVDCVDDTVRKIAENGNRVTFNYYSQYGSDDPLRASRTQSLLHEALRVREAYPDTVVSTPYFIETLLTGKTSFGRFGYDVCPSISANYEGHAERRRNGHPTLPDFNVYAPDLKTVQFCCTSGHCEGCRDSQAVSSWLLASVARFMKSAETLEQWVELAESYWRQFVWSVYHRPAAVLPAPVRRLPLIPSIPA